MKALPTASNEGSASGQLIRAALPFFPFSSGQLRNVAANIAASVVKSAVRACGQASGQL